MSRCYLILLLLGINSCTKNTEGPTKFDGGSEQTGRDQILAFADSINSNVENSTKQESLVYTRNDYSFRVSRYIRNSEVLLYVEHGATADGGALEKKYYLKDRVPVLFIHNNYDPQNARPYKIERTFYENGNVLFSDLKAAETKNELASIPFRSNNVPYVRVEADTKKLNDAIYQRGSFDLLLEGITAYPKAKYLVFGLNKFNSYRAALLIEKHDELIEAILADPDKYRGRKLNVRWEFKGQKDPIYVAGNLAN